MSWVSKLSEELNTRKELWKYYQVTFHHIKDWKNTPIKKLNVKKVYEKLNYWESEAQRLKGLLKDEDPVWLSWRSLLQSFKLSMKWIEKLASDTFGVSFIFGSFILDVNKFFKKFNFLRLNILMSFLQQSGLYMIQKQVTL